LNLKKAFHSALNAVAGTLSAGIQSSAKQMSIGKQESPAGMTSNIYISMSEEKDCQVALLLQGKMEALVLESGT
jgi:hypothetical protein